MKARTIPLLLAVLVVGCASPEERKIKDWLNGKLTSSAEKIKSVEIVGEDSVLSLIPFGFYYRDCLNAQPIPATDSLYFKYGEYLYHAKLARSQVLDGVKKDPSLITAHPYEWRKLYRLNVTGENGTISNDIEVILDVDGSPMLTGREYDTDLSLRAAEFHSIQTLK